MESSIKLIFWLAIHVLARNMREYLKSNSKIENNALYYFSVSRMVFPRALAELIADYCATWEILPWIDPNCISFKTICEDNAEYSCDLMQQYPDRIEWDKGFCAFAGSIDLMRANLDKICWRDLCRNPFMMPLIEEHQDKIDWDRLSGNPAAIDMLLANPERINWRWFSRNPHPRAIETLRANPHNIFLFDLSGNDGAASLLTDINIIDPHAIFWEVVAISADLLKLFIDNPRYPDMRDISRDSSDAAIEFMRVYPNKIDWDYLSENSHPWAIEQLQQHQEKINYMHLSSNPHPWAIEQFKYRSIDRICHETFGATPQMINRAKVSMNKGAIEYLRANPDAIDWNFFSHNPAIFHLVRNTKIIDALLELK